MQPVFLALLIIGVIIYYAFYHMGYRQRYLQSLGQNITSTTGGSGHFEEIYTVQSLVKADVFDFCPFEALDPWHESVANLIDVKYGYDKCDSKAGIEPITVLKEKRIFLKNKSSQYDCKGRCVFHVSDNKYNVSDWIPIQNNTFYCDFVESICKKGRDERKYIHMQIEEKSFPSNNSRVSQKTNPDVHLLVLDSVSSSQFIRALPRTVNFLLHGMFAVEFRKFNKVGSNSRPNAFPALLGKITEKVERKVMNLETIVADLSYKQYCGSYLDNETFIPTEYQKAGYRLKKDDEPDWNKKLDRIISYIETACMIETMLFWVVQGSAQIDTTYSPKFSFTWNVEMAHDNSQNLYKADLALYNFLVGNRMALSNSFIFFFGDHGLRFGKEAHTSIANEERNNPFLYVVVPRSVRKTALYQQLQQNSKEIVTHHDLYASLLDILRFQPASAFNDTSFKVFGPSVRGSSLLRKFESGKPRNCKTLPIPFQYCICQFKKENVTDMSLLSLLGEFVSDQLQLHLNSQNVTSDCENIRILKTEAQQYITTESNLTHMSAASSTIFDVTFEVAPPAKGRFQMPVRKEEGRLQLAGERFMRLDKYGKDGDCMKNDILRPLCTCKSKKTTSAAATSSKRFSKTISTPRSAKSSKKVTKFTSARINESSSATVSVSISAAYYKPSSMSPPIKSTTLQRISSPRTFTYSTRKTTKPS